MKTVLVAGGSGFIGQAVLKALSGQNFEVHAVYHTKSGSSSNITWHKANLLNAEEVSALFERLRPEFLIQLAWCTGQQTYWKDPANFDWITANFNIAQNFVKNGGIRCLFGGTSAEYDWSGGAPLNEHTTPLNPLLLYGGSKLALYWVLTRYFEQEKISFCWTRFFNPFGQGEDSGRLIPKTCLRLLRGDKIDFDAGLSQRDFLHISDVGEAVVHTLTSKLSGAVNVASGLPISIREVITAIGEYYQKAELITFSKNNNSQSIPDFVVANTKRLNEEAGWSPSINFKLRLAETCEWWKRQYKNQDTK